MKVGLALGGGASRGWSHIGVLKALAAEEVVPDIICGTSIGALVGAAHIAGNLEQLEQWVLSLTPLQAARFYEINTSLNGFINSERLQRALCEHVADEALAIESCSTRFAAVATNLVTGHEVWLSDGPVLEAVWASMSLPGLFPAVRHQGRWLADGGLVNPVPVSVCRALGADVVIAVNLNGELVGKHFHEQEQAARESEEPGDLVEKMGSMMSKYTATLFGGGEQEEKPPGLFDAIAGAIDITQDRITRSRMAGDPPDVLLNPRVAHLGLLEFYRAEEAIREGERCVQRELPDIMYRLGRDTGSREGTP